MDLGKVVSTPVDSWWFRTARTDTNGNYTFADLEPGVYTVHFGDCVVVPPTATPPRFDDEYFDDRQTYEEADPVLVLLDPVTGIDASLAPAPE